MCRCWAIDHDAHNAHEVPSPVSTLWERKQSERMGKRHGNSISTSDQGAVFTVSQVGRGSTQHRRARVRSPDERRCEGARENDDRGAGGGRKQPPERARPPRAQEAAPGPRRLHALPVPSAVRSCFLTTKKRQARLLRHDLLWGHRGPHRSWFRSSWITPHAARRLLQESQNQNNCGRLLTRDLSCIDL